MSFCSFLIYNFHNIQEETVFWDTGVLLKWHNPALIGKKKTKQKSALDDSHNSESPHFPHPSKLILTFIWLLGEYDMYSSVNSNYQVKKKNARENLSQVTQYISAFHTLSPNKE